MVTVLVASRTVPPLAMSAYDLTLALPLAARTDRRAAVRVVLPWSMCPIVPTLTCGLVRVNVSLAIVTPCSPVLDYARRRFGINEEGWIDTHQALAPTDIATLENPGRNRPQSCRWDLN